MSEEPRIRTFAEIQEDEKERRAKIAASFQKMKLEAPDMDFQVRPPFSPGDEK